MKIPTQRASRDRYAIGRGPAVPGSSPEVWGKTVKQSVRLARSKLSAEFKRRYRKLEESSSEEVVRVPDELDDSLYAGLEELAQPEPSKPVVKLGVVGLRPAAEREVTWRYLPGSRVRVKHALTISGGRATGHINTSRCGLYCWDATTWHGTGSQGEYDKLDRLPRCRSCERTLVFSSPANEVPDGTGQQGWKSRGQNTGRGNVSEQAHQKE